MNLHNIIASRLLTQSRVIANVGRNTKSYTALADQYCVRVGGLYEHDPYPGVVITVPNQTIHSDLSDITRMATGELVIRTLSYSLSEAYKLANNCAWNADTPPNPPTKPASGLDGWKDISKGIQSMGLRSITEEPVAPVDAKDRLFWLVEYTFSVDWWVS